MKKINKKSKLVLYKMNFSSRYNRSLAPRTEYCKSRISLKELLKGVTLWCKMEGTEYYGYTNVEITKEKYVPEICQITIDIPDEN